MTKFVFVMLCYFNYREPQKLYHLWATQTWIHLDLSQISQFPTVIPLEIMVI